MLKVYHPGSSLNMVSLSPFCLKLVTFLKYHQIPFTEEFGIPNQGPFSKVPFVEIQGEKMGDSTMIMERLRRECQIPEPELSDTQKAIGHAFVRMTEEHLYWIMVHGRWVEEDTWAIIRKVFFGSIPPVIRQYIAYTSRKMAFRNLYSQGVGRLPKSEVYKRGERDLLAISHQVNQHGFIAGDTFSDYDIAIWALLQNLLVAEVPSPLTVMAKRIQPLQDYCHRVNQHLAAAGCGQNPAIVDPAAPGKHQPSTQAA